jgi:phosphoglycolate phosphatase/AHBA synthesis associated protein
MVRLRAVIFDMDGTVIDSLESVPAAYIATVKELTGRPCTVEEVVANYSVGPGKAMLSVLLGRRCEENDLGLYHDHLRRNISLVRTYPSVETTLSTLAATLKVGVFTGAGRGAAELLLAHAGLQKYLEVVVTGDDILRPKPAPDGILAACEGLGASPKEAAYVGDAPNDMQAATAAEVLAVLAGWGHQYKPSTPADLVVPDPTGLVHLLLTELPRE